MTECVKKSSWKLDDSLLPWEREALCDPAELAEAFGTSLRFGTGGIRARMGAGPGRLNRLTVAWAAAGLAAHLREAVCGTPRVVVAHDTREHSREFAEAVCGALAAAGCQALFFDHPVPTPALSFAVRELGADAGVVITASHNSREDNGFKVYGPTGCQATDALCRAVAARMDALDPLEVPTRDFVCLVKPQFRECARISFGSVHETFAGLRTDPPTLTTTS